ncbi:MAG: trypsin-like peptidase domain-containing protein [Candidatus Diapherotrites archaeon]|uniref:Trypsin-like peptidase domain-containing protein n=1 Tax=Candidatus Iainarchaeum sp. TaxID=3101447 RepID=A0A8T3YKL4_9ARCH|nr:trypsin-like peptidase domain-containing protein [Candidatus Diapherotrites archaeon]
MSWLIPDWQKTVVYLGQEIKDQEGAKKIQIGTGALLQVSGVFCLITCKHVIIDENGKFRENLFAAFNSKSGTVIERKIDDIKRGFSAEWHFHANKDVDIAVIGFGLDVENDDVKTIESASFLDIKELNVADDIFLLGFQPGLSTAKIKPIVRNGIISRIEEDRTFYIDASVFPGNSGSPVLLKPSPIAIKEKGIQFGATHLGRFIGICSEYIPYQDIAVSVQTRRPRIIFEENTGLAKVWSIDIIKEILDSASFKQYLEKSKPARSDQNAAL